MTEKTPDLSEEKKVFTPDMTREPKYEWGLRVTALEDLYNDGSYPDLEEGALIVAKGSVGEIRQIGHIEDANCPLYLVEFASGHVVGVLEEEISPILGERQKAPGMM